MKIFAVIIAVLLVLGVAKVVSDNSDSASDSIQSSVASGEVSPENITKEVENGEARLVDVRTVVEYDLNHAVPAENFALGKIENGEIPDIDVNEKVYVYCRSGNRSATAKKLLEAKGYTNIIDLGGITSWTDNGGEIVRTELEPYKDILASLGKPEIEPLGNPNAELVVVKYVDFSCPYCSKFTEDVEPQIKQAYTDTNKIRYEFRNYAYLGDESALAAVGGYCANEQGKFWPYHDALNIGYANIGADFYTPENLKSVMQTIKGDSNAFEQCLNSEVYDTVVSAETQDVKDSGVESTPTVKVGDQLIKGLLPYNVYEELIELYQ